MPIGSPPPYGSNSDWRCRLEGVRTAIQPLSGWGPARPYSPQSPCYRPYPLTVASAGRVCALYLNVLTIRQRCEWLVCRRGLLALYAKQELSAQAIESRALIYTMGAAVIEKFRLPAIRFWRQKQGGRPNPPPERHVAGRLPAKIAVRMSMFKVIMSQCCSRRDRDRRLIAKA